jgi:hypothetical protein
MSDTALGAGDAPESVAGFRRVTAGDSRPQPQLDVAPQLVLQLQQLDVLQLQQLDVLQLELHHPSAMSSSPVPSSTTTAGALMPMLLISSISKVSASSLRRSSAKLICIGN